MDKADIIYRLRKLSDDIYFLVNELESGVPVPVPESDGEKIYALDGTGQPVLA